MLAKTKNTETVTYSLDDPTSIMLEHDLLDIPSKYIHQFGDMLLPLSTWNIRLACKSPDPLRLREQRMVGLNGSALGLELLLNFVALARGW